LLAWALRAAFAAAAQGCECVLPATMPVIRKCLLSRPPPHHHTHTHAPDPPPPCVPDRPTRPQAALAGLAAADPDRVHLRIAGLGVHGAATLADFLPKKKSVADTPTVAVVAMWPGADVGWLVVPAADADAVPREFRGAFPDALVVRAQDVTLRRWLGKGGFGDAYEATARGDTFVVKVCCCVRFAPPCIRSPQEWCVCPSECVRAACVFVRACMRGVWLVSGRCRICLFENCMPGRDAAPVHDRLCPLSSANGCPLGTRQCTCLRTFPCTASRCPAPRTCACCWVCWRRYNPFCPARAAARSSSPWWA
jgi:hypothetical protein